MLRRLALATFVAVTPLPAAAQSGRIYGDCAVPPDGVVNVLDGLASGRFSVGLDPLPQIASPDFLACDVNDDGSINVLDSFSISVYSVGRSVPEPVGQVIPNAPPVAEAGGPYTGIVGGQLVLDGTASTDDHPPIAAYSWDLDDNGSFETPGSTVAISCTAVAAFDVGLRVTDSFGSSSTDVASVTCSAPVDIYTQWTNASGSPVTTVAAGAQVFLNICASVSATQAFQAVVSVAGPAARTGNGSDLNAAAAGGLCGDPAASDLVGQYTAQAPPVNPFNFQNYSLSPSAGVGKVGLARIPFTAQGAGAVTVAVQVQVWGLFAGQPPASPSVLVGPLTVN
jgi:hypothetical protein